MKRNFLRIIASMAILSILLPTAPIKAQPSAQPQEFAFQNSEFSGEINLPEGVTDSEWQDIQSQILSSLAQQAYLKSSNTNAADDFGWSVAISGDTLVVGAFREDSAATGVNGNQNDNSASDAGAAYVFVRSGTSWSQQAYLKASNTNAGDNFGNPVAIYGGTIVVSAPLEDSATTGINGNQSDNSASGAGAVYVFVRSGTTWSQQAYLKASNTNAEDYFGDTIAISQDTIVVGAPGEDSAATGVNGNQGDNSASYAGAAYVFVRSGTSWSQQAYLKASNTNAYDDFGFPVSISGDTIVVGAPLEDSAATGVNGNQGDNSASSSGAAYVFVRSSSSWSQQAYLKASNTNAGDYFGNSLSISSDTIAIGAPREDSSATGVNGNQNDNSASWAGAAYVFVRSSTTWSQQAYLKASNTQADDYFGEAVGISGDTIVIGALYEDSSATGVNGNQGDNSAIDAGAAYVFVRSGTSWSQDAYLKASNTNAGDGFSDSVALSGDTILIGAPYEDSAATGVNGNQNDNSADGAGAAYVFFPKRFSGVIEDDLGNAIPAIDVLLSDGRTTKTNSNGYYEFDINASGEFTVLPIFINYRFAPPYGKVSWPDSLTQDFIMRPANPEPFLDLPFEPIIYDGFTEEESFAITVSGNIDRTGESGKVNSWFDHDGPVYDQDDNSHLLRWDGAEKSDPANLVCSWGDNCYDGHDGIDFHLTEGIDLYAPDDGIVVYTSSAWPLGNHVVLDHNNGYFTLYGHLQTPSLVSGEVHKGDIIGKAGSTGNSTGPHLHFAVYYDVNGNGLFDRYTDKVVDPFGWNPDNPGLDDPWGVTSDYLWIYSNALQCNVSPAGTTQNSPTGFWTMQIPTGGVAADINLEILENPPIGYPLENYVFTGQSFTPRILEDINAQTTTGSSTPDGNAIQELLLPMTLTAKYFPLQLPHHDLSKLSVFQWNEDELTWTELASDINTTDRTVSAQTTSFGQFALQAPLICSNAINEPNDNYDAATYLVENSASIMDNFDFEIDEDWFRLPAERGNKYEIAISEIDPGVEVFLEFYDKDGFTLLFDSSDPSFVEWCAPDSGTYFIRVVRQPNGIYGCESGYSIELSAYYFNYVPIIQR